MMAEQAEGDIQSVDVYRQMQRMVTSHWVLQVVHAAVDWSLANHPAQRGLTSMLVGELSDPAPGSLDGYEHARSCPGQERSLAEYEVLLSAAGLRRTVVLPTSSAQRVIEAVAASTSLGLSESPSTNE